MGDAFDGLSLRYRSVGAASLVVGPALMSVGDLLHPAESWATDAQVVILIDSPGRWYAAHLLLFIGMLLFVPGILALTEVASSRRSRAGYVARVLMLASVGALSAVFVFEMVLGRFIAGGADRQAGVALLETFQSPVVFGALVPGLLAFFIGTAIAVVTLVSPAGPFRWPAIAFALGAFLILGEIILAKVLLSQIGNIVNLVGGIGFARALMRRPMDSHDRSSTPVT